MQLEIKIVIDFSDDGPATSDMNDIMRLTSERLQGDVYGPLLAFHDAKVRTSMGWTSSGDDEE